jgi:hypothetical protein
MATCDPQAMRACQDDKAFFIGTANFIWNSNNPYMGG